MTPDDPLTPTLDEQIQRMVKFISGLSLHNLDRGEIALREFITAEREAAIKGIYHAVNRKLQDGDDARIVLKAINNALAQLEATK